MIRIFLSPLESRLAPGEWLFSNLMNLDEFSSAAIDDHSIGLITEPTTIRSWLADEVHELPEFSNGVFEAEAPREFDTQPSSADLGPTIDLPKSFVLTSMVTPAIQTKSAMVFDTHSMGSPHSIEATPAETMVYDSSLATSPIFASEVEQQSLHFPTDRSAFESLQTFVGPKRDPKSSTTLEMGFTQTEIMIGVNASKADALALLSSSRLAERIDLESSYVILEQDGISLTFASLKPGTEVMPTIEMAKGERFVSWAEPNEYVIGDAHDLTPNDTNWTNAGQYFHTLSQTNLAWDIQTGDSSVIVAVTDDGVGYNHPDLAPNIWSNSKEANGTAGVDDDGNGRIDDIRGWDFSGSDNNPLPAGTSTHGTHVSGIIAARTNNALGVAGTAGGNNTTPGISIMPVRWDGTTSWTAAVVASSFAYAADNGAKIISSSYNFDGFASSTTVNTSFNYSYGKGVLHFNSSGNNAAFEPARRVFNQTLFVASHDSANAKSSFSNYGPFVDISGNGSSIYSTTTGTDGTTVTYSTLSGTSMSTPHAAGVAALIWSQNPTWTRDQVVAQMLGMADVVDSANSTLINQLGTGRVNAYRAITEPLPAPRFGNVTGLPANGSSIAPFASFTVDVPMRLNPASVTAANFELRGAGLDRQFNTTDDVLVPLVINTNANYMVGTNSLAFTKSGGGNFASDLYRFRGLSGATQLRDAFDTPLDGNSDNTAGGHFERTFTVTGSNTNSLTGTIFEDRNGNATRESYDAALTGSTQPTVYLDANNNGLIDTNVTTVTYSGSAVAIPASGRVFVPLNVSGMQSPLTDVDVKLNITHPRLSDLDVFLVSPQGTRVELLSDVGANGANFVNTVLNDAATTAVTAGSAPFSNSFRPEIALSRLNGESGNGGWLLEIVDDNPAAIAGTPQVNDFSLILSNQELTTTPNSQGVFSFASLPAGDYVVRATTPTGFTATGANIYSVTIGEGELKSGLDFGLAKNNRIYSRVYTDANDNGSWDTGEAGVAGRTVFIDANGNGSVDKTTTSLSNTTAVSIPDAGAVVSSSVVSNVIGSVADVNVTINVTHPYVGDLTFFLVHPNGTRVELATNVGGSGDNFTNTVFDDEATTLVTAGTAPFTGIFRPEGSLAVLDGLPTVGTWRLEVQDVGAQDIGTLDNWTLTLNSSEVAVTTDANGNATFDVASGTYPLINTKLAQVRPTGPTSSMYSVTAAGAPLYDRSFGVIADTTGPTIATTTIDTGGIQRSRVGLVSIALNELVTFSGSPASAVVIAKNGGGSVTPSVSVDNSGPATILNITFADTTEFGSIVDGDYTITLNGTQILDLAQNAMTGTPSVSFHRLYGDINGDRTINGIDLGQFRNTFGTSNGNTSFIAALDYNNDSTINGIDLGQFRNRFGTTLP